MRAVDRWMLDKYETNLSSYGVVYANVGGGSNMYDYSLLLNKLGYKTCIFADDDNGETFRSKQEECLRNGIQLFLCESGLCIEKQIMLDVSIDALAKIAQCNQAGFPKKHPIPQKKLLDYISKIDIDNQESELRMKIGD